MLKFCKLAIFSLLAGMAYGQINNPTSGGGGSAPKSWVFRGSVQAAAQGGNWGLPSSNALIPINIGGTDSLYAVQAPCYSPNGSCTATFSAVQYAYADFILPSGYTANSAISFSMESMCDVNSTCDSAHAAIITLSLSCATTPASPSYTAAPTFNITNPGGGTSLVTTGTITPNSGGLPACAAGNHVRIKVAIDTNTNAFTGPFDLLEMAFSITGGGI